jgi:hypothetical protein
VKKQRREEKTPPTVRLVLKDGSVIYPKPGVKIPPHLLATPEEEQALTKKPSGATPPTRQS